MSVASTPYGFKPLNILGGQPMSHGVRQYAIPSAYATSIFFGDPVLLTLTGATRGQVQRFNETVAQGTVSATATPVGVFMGCQYTDPTFGKVFRQYWPGGTVVAAADAVAFVCDDPDALFQVQADGVIAQTRIGCNASIIQTVVGNPVTGNSGLCLQASSVANTATLPLRIVDYVNAPGSSLGDAFTDVIVRFNTHFNRSTTGVAAA